MTEQPTATGRYLLRAFRAGTPISDPRAGWDDLAAALFLAVDRADDAATRGATADSWVIHDRLTGTDIVRIDVGARVHYLT